MDKQRKKHDHTPRRTLEEIQAELAALTTRAALTTPKERAEIRAEREAQAAREVRYTCAWHRCVNVYDPETSRITWGFGAIGCPCDTLPGWRGRHPEMMAKPGWTAKSTGRNGSRVQRSKRRHRGVGPSGYMKWAEEWEARMVEEARDVV